LQLARSFANGKNTEKAIAYYESVLKLDPQNQEAAQFIQDHLGVRFHPEVGQAFFKLLSEQPGFARNEREVTLQELEPGMKVMCNVFSASGILLIPSGQVLTPKLIQYIRQHNHAEPLAQRIFIES
ncbi:MAG: hypothetical protein HY360_11725, partial [Verrucomicrobia bacterium]|nr:hypothetical protein [Verrucomicrobiota bacterium]